MHNMAIHQNGEQPNPTCNPFIRNIFWHRFPFSFRHPSSADVSSAQQCKPVSPSIRGQPATVKYTHANESIHPQAKAGLLLLFLWRHTVSPSICNHCAGFHNTKLLRTFPTMGWSPLSYLGQGWRPSPPQGGHGAGNTGQSPSAL